MSISIAGGIGTVVNADCEKSAFHRPDGLQPEMRKAAGYGGLEVVLPHVAPRYCEDDDDGDCQHAQLCRQIIGKAAFL